ncbi:hypothetical protein PAP_07060 [Palaeococcus pacificus DY20341]|uniref:FAD-binding domain-containing protein n=1 Tax=Palaeococcus pacificus DY20341 TaxID=1343739 RepID=A0A075LTV6_9EURY|nr:NAD(P)/FAD-dependent oxidoreductase [Palaeococcus pacificus]AIF69804.1 hypothetical protein PAP_07060 [Palaeococcus pacificus DY20341]
MAYDVMIIGAGPVGSYLATLLARDFNVLVVEQKSSFGEKACTGIIGAESYEKLGLPKKAVLNAFRGAKFYSKIQSFKIERKSPQAYMVDRRVLERELARKAILKGAEYSLSTKFLEFKNGRALLQKHSDVFEVEAKVYIGADGVHSRVAQAIGAKSKGEFLPGFEMEIIGNFDNPDFVEVWVDKELNEDFFFWVAPIDENLARVGTIGRLDSLYKFLKIRMLTDKSAIEFKAGSVGIGVRKPWVRRNVALVGDAALQLKPLTAGGIAYGMFCAHALAYALKEGDLKRYEKICSDIKREISFGLRARKLFKALNQEQMEKIFELLSTKEAREVIEQTADFDEHAKTIKALLKHPRLLAKALKITPMLIRYLL